MATQNQLEYFDQILIEVMDDALSRLGENVNGSIRFQLLDLFKIKKQEIHPRIHDFSDALKYIFGSGAMYASQEAIR